MKYLFFTLLVFAIVNCSNEQSSKSISNLSSFKDSTSYALGADLGENLRRQNVDIDYDVFMAGLTDGMETGLIKLDQKQRREVMATLQKKLREKADSEGINNLKLALVAPTATLSVPVPAASSFSDVSVSDMQR